MVTSKGGLLPQTPSKPASTAAANPDHPTSSGSQHASAGITANDPAASTVNSFGVDLALRTYTCDPSSWAPSVSAR